jgi:hypothetical protein
MRVNKLMLFEMGLLVGEYESDCFTFECRQIDGFYVDYKKKDKYYVDMRTFRNPDLLQPYFKLAY